MAPAGTRAMDWWRLAISLCWRCRLTAWSSTGRASLALSAQPLARQLGIYQPGGHHGCLRDGVEPVRHRPRPDPLALRGRLGSSFARFIGGTNYVAEIE